MIKTWQLAKSIFDENDLLWCKSLGITVHVDTDTNDFFIAGSASTFKVISRLNITLSTSTEKQETALHLKYGDNLQLIEEKIFNIKI